MNETLPVLDPKSKALLTVEEARKQISVSRASIYRWMDEGKLKSLKIGRCRRIAPGDLEQFLERCRAN